MRTAPCTRGGWAQVNWAFAVFWAMYMGAIAVAAALAFF